MRVGIHCPVDGANISDDVCLACRVGKARPASGEKCDFPYEELRGMMDDDNRKTARISATMMGGACPRSTWLKSREDYYANPEANYHSFRGTISHLIFELYPEPGAVYEQRFELVLPNGELVTGKIDKFHPERGEIMDRKTKQEDKDPPKKAEKSHVYQVNVYRYLLKHGYPQEPILVDGLGQPLATPILPGVPANIEANSLWLRYWTLAWGRLLPAPVLTDEEVLTYMMRGEVEQGGDIIPEVPKSLDPTGMKYGKGISTFCSKFCPVREKCLEYLLDE